MTLITLRPRRGPAGPDLQPRDPASTGARPRPASPARQAARREEWDGYRSVSRRGCTLLAVPSTADRPEDLHRALDLVIAFVGPGFTVERFESGGKPSALVYHGPSRRPRFRVVFNAHLDVVPAAADAVPAATRRRSPVRARGTGDEGVGLVQAQVFRELASSCRTRSACSWSPTRRSAAATARCTSSSRASPPGSSIIGETSGLRIATESKGILPLTCARQAAARTAPTRGWATTPCSSCTAPSPRLLAAYPFAAEEIWRTTVNLARVETPNRARNQVPAQAEAWLDIRFPPEDPDLSGKTADEVTAYLASFCEPGVTAVVEPLTRRATPTRTARRCARSSRRSAPGLRRGASAHARRVGRGFFWEQGMDAVISASAATACMAPMSTWIPPRSPPITRR